MGEVVGRRRRKVEKERRTKKETLEGGKCKNKTWLYFLLGVGRSCMVDVGGGGKNSACLYSALSPTFCPKFHPTHKPM